MFDPSLITWSWGTTLVLLAAACVTDLRWRRIPNYLTFPAIALGLTLHSAANGWEGFLLSLGGAILSPLVLWLAHRGKGPGMGDRKLAMALGALLGLPLGLIAMLLSMLAGGLLAVVWMMREWGFFGHGAIRSIVGRALPSKDDADPTPRDVPPVGRMAIPYGLALAVGTAATLVLWLWNGNRT